MPSSLVRLAVALAVTAVWIISSMFAPRAPALASVASVQAVRGIVAATFTSPGDADAPLPDSVIATAEGCEEEPEEEEEEEREKCADGEADLVADLVVGRPPRVARVLPRPREALAPAQLHLHPPDPPPEG